MQADYYFGGPVADAEVELVVPGRLLAKGGKSNKSAKSGKGRRLLKGSSGKGSKASKGGCGPDRFTGVYNYVAPYGTPYRVTFATRL